MRYYSQKTHRFHHHRKGKRIGTNNDFERSSKLQFTFVWYSISRKRRKKMIPYYLKNHIANVKTKKDATVGILTSSAGNTTTKFACGEGSCKQ